MTKTDGRRPEWATSARLAATGMIQPLRPAPPVTLGSRHPGVASPQLVREFTFQLAPVRDPPGAQLTGLDRGQDRAARLAHMTAPREPAAGGQGRDVVEGQVQAGRR